MGKNEVVASKDWNKSYPNKSHRENYLKAVEFRSPDWIPCSVSIFPAVWAKYRDQLRDIVLRHPFIFGKYLKFKKNYDNIPLHHRPNTYWTDNWGCKWYVSKGGFEGLVVESPLADWNAFNSYQFPDPLKFSERGKRQWFGQNIAFKGAKRMGILTAGSGERLFDRLYFLRGFDNLMSDFASRNPNLPRLIEKFTNHELTLIKKWLSYHPDQINFHTDIGTQDRLMISPRQFRQYIKPMFKTLFQTCRHAGSYVYLSSDGHLLEIVDDLIECGVSIHDPQERANTIEGIQKHYKGKMCIDLDLDRQIFPFSGPDAIDKQIKRAVEMLNSPEGGFMMKAEISDTNIPLENIEAICNAFENYCIPKR
jgi:uroporphyrinogen decarboxylase